MDWLVITLLLQSKIQRKFYCCKAQKGSTYGYIKGVSYAIKELYLEIQLQLLVSCREKKNKAYLRFPKQTAYMYSLRCVSATKKVKKGNNDRITLKRDVGHSE